MRLALVFAALALLASPAHALDAPRPTAPNSYAPIVRQALPAVVNVFASRTETRPRNPLFDDPAFQRFFGAENIPRQRTQQSLGSGVIVDASGLVVTNHHVIEGMTEVKVALSDKREFEAEIVLRDQRSDLAVLKLKGAGPFPVVELGDSDALEVGDVVLAIGNPFGVGQTVTHGIVSALARTQGGISDYGFFIQTDAPINPGNSGGALVDMNARLAGINSSIFSQTGSSVGIGFAIPINMVKGVIATAKSGGKQVRRPWLGASLQNVTKEIADSMGLDRPNGAIISDVFDKSPAVEAGLKRGDIIQALDGQKIDDVEAFGYRFGTHPLGGSISISLLRAGKPVSVALKLIGAPETPLRDARKLTGKQPFAGASVANLSPAVIEELGLEKFREGVVVTEIEDGSIAQQLSVQKNDVIISVNDVKIGNVRELEKLVAGRHSAWKLTIGRAGEVFTSVVDG